MANELRALLGRTGNVVLDIFEFIEVAEREIAKAKAERPEAAERIDRLFIHLQPAHVKVPARIYLAHVRELIARVVAEEDLRPATKAELCLALSHGSLARPPARDEAAAYARIFSELFPEQGELAEGFSESYPGAADEVLEPLARRIAKDRDRPRSV